MDCREYFGYALRGFMERDGNGDCSRGVDGMEVLGQAALVVGEAVGDVQGAGGLRDGDVDGCMARRMARHGFSPGGDYRYREQGVGNRE